jgi:hypothetical protein
LLNARAFYNVLAIEISLEVGNLGSEAEEAMIGTSSGDTGLFWVIALVGLLGAAGRWLAEKTALDPVARARKTLAARGQTISREDCNAYITGLKMVCKSGRRRYSRRLAARLLVEGTDLRTYDRQIGAGMW